MRVGLFSNAYHPLISGVVNSLEGIRSGLLARGHQPYLFAPDVRGFQDTQSGVFRFRSLEMTKRVSYPIPIPYSNRLFKLIRQLDLDVIHSHHPFLLGEVAATFAQQKQIPLIYTFHTQLEHYSHYIPLNQLLVRGVARSRLTRYLNKCDLVIAPSGGIRSLLDSYGVRTRVETLSNAIDTERFQLAPTTQCQWRHSLNISPQQTVSLSVGRLGQEKNLDFLLRCFAKLPTHSDQVLVLIGDGTERRNLMALAAELEIADRVRFPGSVPYLEMPAVYASSDLFVICSTTEVKPLVVLEALASGLPVLAVAACGTQDTLHHRVDGWLCQPLEADFIEGWTVLLEQPNFRRQLGMAARKTASAYSFEIYLTRLTELYREAIADYRPRSSRRLDLWAEASSRGRV